ncbi:hypothetical protein [Variovorax saccharolyticus]|uniref:hypothetical protein n=1 Tax=Variovorax saccharolyticus TaxID=3053516 RepID=UPI0025779AE2|nr:hypothetical protein [Variovorax sp. J31P216]MDM0030411.1 hypothetical protein [Variovorax sp. J31P216]
MWAIVEVAVVVETDNSDLHSGAAEKASLIIVEVGFGFRIWRSIDRALVRKKGESVAGLAQESRTVATSASKWVYGGISTCNQFFEINLPSRHGLFQQSF